MNFNHMQIISLIFNSLTADFTESFAKLSFVVSLS